MNKKSFWENIRGEVCGNDAWSAVETEEMGDVSDSSASEESSSDELHDGGFGKGDKVRQRSRSPRRGVE